MATVSLPGGVLSVSPLPSSNLPSSTSSLSTATSTSSAPTSSSSNGILPLFFNTVPEMWTCGAAVVTWDYLGSSSGLRLVITDSDVTQQSPPTNTQSDGTDVVSIASESGVARFARRDTLSVTQTIGTDLDPSLSNWTWSQVDVPQGWYVLQASIASLSSQSDSFFVHNGTDTSCVIGSAPSPSSASATISASSSTSPSPSTSAILVSGSSKNSHAGAIAGGVVGGVAFVAAVLAAVLFWLCRRRPTRGRARVLGAEAGHSGSNGKWNGLATVTARSLKKARHTSDSGDGLSKNMHDPSPSARASQLGRTPIGSDEEINSIAEEKMIVADGAAPVPPHYYLPPTKRTSSSSTVATANYRSRPSSQRALSSPEPPRNGHHSSKSIEAIAHARLGRPISYAPGAASPEMIPLERSGSGSAAAARRAARKPVPQYDYSEFDEPASPPVAMTASGSPESMFEGTLTNASNSYQGHGAFPSKIAFDDTPTLHHQASFGNMRPMHVMMPDMPPPMRD